VKRLLLVSQRPQEYGGAGSARWNAFRAMLPAHGWEVDVVTARPNPTGDEYAADATARRLNAARAAVMARAGAVLRPAARRLAGIEPEALAPSALWAITGRRAVRAAIAEHRPDVVWATSPPIAAHLVMAGLAGELTVPLVCELRDNWAGNPYYDAGGSVLTRIEARALAPATRIVVVTPSMVGVVAGLHPQLADRVTLLPNGFDPVVLEDRRPRRAPAPGGPVTLVHAGPVHGYPGRTVEPLLAALRRPELRGRARLHLIGPGAEPGAEGADVAVTPTLPWRDAVRAQAEADIGVVLYSSDRSALGTKVYEQLALGKPVLALVDRGNALHALLEQLGQGAGCVAHDDPAAIAAAIARLIEEPPPPVPPEALAPWDRSRIAGDVAALLEELTT
jgi:glycosyltransferase involved in cell wall biosynthesis